MHLSEIVGAAQIEQAGVFGHHRVMQRAAVVSQAFRETVISNGEDLRRQQPGIKATSDGHRGHGNATGHLHNRVQRIHPGEGAALHRHTDDGKGGEGGHHARKVRSTPGAGHDHPETLIPCLLGKVDHLQWGAMGGEHPHLHLNPQLPEDGRRRLHRGQVGIATHHHGHTGKHCRHGKEQQDCHRPPQLVGMRRISGVRVPAPLGGDAGQRHRLELDESGRIQGIEAINVASGQDNGGTSDADWQGDWISPRGIDLQINGGLGLAFPELTEQDQPRLMELLEQLWLDGVEAIAPTLVTCGTAPLRRALGVLRTARDAHRPGRCRLLGAHLEGPFLAEARRGAHPSEHLAAPSVEALTQRIGGFEQEIALVTLAPELEGADAVIQRLRELKITVALGHSAASADSAAQAFEQGVGMLTHAFNAMPGLHHRAPGPLGEACRRGDIALGLIADGVHVHPTMAVLLQRLAPNQTVLVSDALAPYGLADGEHRWDERVLLVSDGTCRLDDGTLAGVTLPQLEGVKRLASWSGNAGAAIWSATVAPRRVIGTATTARDALIGQPLTQLLRWSQHGGKLQWACAA